MTAAADPTTLMPSAWLKWARAVEHQKALARATREWVSGDPHRYERSDNRADRHDPIVRMEWRLRVQTPYPGRWGVLLGDAVTNLRAALDHAFWAAAVVHTGPPAHPQAVQFPIAPTARRFADPARRLAPLVAATVWETVAAVQPFHGGPQAHTAPLEVLRWLSNADKHRSLRVVQRLSVDMGPAVLRAAVPLEVVDEWRPDGPAADGDVIARLALRRPGASQDIDITPVFGHTACVQICESPNRRSGPSPARWTPSATGSSRSSSRSLTPSAPPRRRTSTSALSTTRCSPRRAGTSCGSPTTTARGVPCPSRRAPRSRRALSAPAPGACHPRPGLTNPRHRRTSQASR